MDLEEEPLRIAIIGRHAQHMAEDWSEFLRPVDYDRVHRVDGIRVRVRIETYVTSEDTQPVKVQP